jgi:hypothetical protein
VAVPEAEDAVVAVVAVEHEAVFALAPAAVVFAAASVADTFAAVPAAVVFAAASLADIFVAAFVAAADAAVSVADIVVAASVADVAELQASVDIVLVFDVLVPVPVGGVEVDSPGRPRFFDLPNVAHYASPSSSVEGVGQESVHSSTGVRTSYGLCSILSNPGRHHNKSLERSYNKPNPGHNNVNDTNDLPMDATTSHSRKKGLLLHQEQRTHRAYQAALSLPEVPQIQWVPVLKFQYLHRPLPLLEQKRQLPTPQGLSTIVSFSFCCLLIWFDEYLGTAAISRAVTGRVLDRIVHTAFFPLSSFPALR